MDEPDDEDPAWQRVIEELAEREGADPTALDPPLGAVIDPAAIESVLSSARDLDTQASVRFEYRDYEVAVHSDGEVAVTPDDAEE